MITAHAAQVECMHLASDRFYTGGLQGISIFDSHATTDIYHVDLLGYGFARVEYSDGYCGIQSVGDVIYLAEGNLSILRARPDLFGATAAIAPPGGNLVSYDQSISFNFPSGSVVNTTTVTYNGLFASSQPPYAGRGTVRSFTIGTSEFAAQTAQPYTMAISYTDGALKSLGIADESSLNLAYWDGKAWKDLLPCAGCALDTQSNRLTVRTNRLAEFVLSGARPAVFVPVMRR